MRNCVDSCRSDTARLSPSLNGSSEIRRFERSDTSETRNRLMTDFYTELTHNVILILCSIPFRYDHKLIIYEVTSIPKDTDLPLTCTYT